MAAMKEGRRAAASPPPPLQSTVVGFMFGNLGVTARGEDGIVALIEKEEAATRFLPNLTQSPKSTLR